jgi:hypothetical protein
VMYDEEDCKEGLNTEAKEKIAKRREHWKL